MRLNQRSADATRPVTMETGVSDYAEGSCLIRFGNTRVLCTATVEEKTPPFLRNTGKGWVTAEYGMLPRSTHSRMNREAAHGKQSGRTVEIQRLIGRSLRAAVDLPRLGERQVIVDCDVINADGGTRTAAITGGYVALHLALRKVGMEKAMLDQVAAVSCGVKDGVPIMDLDYAEDSTAEVDANFVMTRDKIIEIQGTAEHQPFDDVTFMAMMALGRQGINHLMTLQRQALGL